jgi:myb proto-oncogene protein
MTADSPYNAPADPVTPAASLPSASISRAPRRSWKPEEDEMPRKAVATHGNDWSAVALMVPDRNKTRCRDRWFKNLDPAIKKKGPRRPWTQEQDAKLREAVNIHYTQLWITIAKMVPGRKNTACRQRWVEVLDKWTPEEDAKLREAVKEHGEDWVAVDEMVPV